MTAIGGGEPALADPFALSLVPDEERWRRTACDSGELMYARCAETDS